MPHFNKKNIAILGSTGSIGTQTEQIVLANPNMFNVIVISASGNNINSLAAQCERLNPKYVVVCNEVARQQLSTLISSKIKILLSRDYKTLCENITLDIAVIAISGFAGAAPTLQMAKCSKTLAIANKESIICAWDIIKKEADIHGCKIEPLDSEHNGIYELLKNASFTTNELSNITITASGGPFWNYEGDMSAIIPAQAMKHPKWNMGTKNSIDSATLFNKGLEIIEACTLFNVPTTMVDAVIHPNAIVHACVETKSGNSFAMMSQPDMKLHISNVLINNYGLHQPIIKPLNLSKIGKLEFFPIQEERFPAIKIAKQAFNASRSHVICFNAADEIAVDLFVNGAIKFNEIIPYIEETLQNVKHHNPTTIEEILYLDRDHRKNAIHTMLGAKH